MSYADDVLVYRQGNDREQVAEELQLELERNGVWCEDAEALVNPTKAAVSWFSLNNRIANTPTPSVSLSSGVVERSQSMKYLWIQFDRSLAFAKHIDHVVMKAKNGLAAMRVMVAAECEQQNLVVLFKGLVLSVIKYALAILTLSATHREKLERIQNEAMRIILECTKETDSKAMRYLLDFPPMEDRAAMANMQMRTYESVLIDIIGSGQQTGTGKIMDGTG